MAMIYFMLIASNAVFFTSAYFHKDDVSLLITVNPETQQFVDSLGRERFFHGTNVVVKQPPYHPKTTGTDIDAFSEADMKLLQSLGLNAVRLGWY